MPELKYYTRVRGRILGPFDWPQLRVLRDRGQLNRFHEISTDRRTWVPASTLPELFETEEVVELKPVPEAPPAAAPVAKTPAPQYTAAELGQAPRPRPFRLKTEAAGGSRALLWGGLAVGALLLVIVTAVGAVLLLSWKNAANQNPPASVNPQPDERSK